MTDHPRPRKTLSTAPAFCALIATVIALTATPVWARTKEQPISFRKATAPRPMVDLHTMVPVDVERLRAEDEVAEASPVPGPTRFATVLDVDLNLENSGTWDHLDDGGRLWRLRIESPGALSLNLGFRHFDVPEDARMWVYDSRGTTVKGAYTRADRAHDGSLWTPVLLDDEAVIELYLPASSTDANVELATVSHGYRFFGEIRAKQGSCNIDVVCDEVTPYRDQARAIARYTVRIGNSSFFCTGNLVHNTAGDFRPFFLTAEHCGVDASTASSLVVTWNYESANCGDRNGGSGNDFQNGATHLASYVPSDFTLVELDHMPDPSYNVFYAGWDASGATPTSVVGIHHPQGDEKSAAFEGDALVSTDINGLPGGSTHWRVNAWDLGTTERGSSGSCIFDQSNRGCVGTLTGGVASCTNPTGFDVYGKFSTSWTGGGTNNSRLSNWLDPVGSNTTFLAGSDQGGVAGGCVADADTLCLNNNRFKVEVRWSSASNSGDATVVPGGTGDSSNFWFFSANNWELLFKVLDGCDINDRFWVFFAATTDVGFTATVTDTVTNTVKTYSNPDGQAANAVTDTNAFETCQ